jgi:hypothetical protein
LRGFGSRAVVAPEVRSTRPVNRASERESSGNGATGPDGLLPVTDERLSELLGALADLDDRDLLVICGHAAGYTAAGRPARFPLSRSVPY